MISFKEAGSNSLEWQFYGCGAGPNPRVASPVLGSMYATVTMDAHTLELLEFGKVRDLLAGYAACSLGKELANRLEPMTDPDRIRAELDLVTEMTDALGQGQTPPFGGLHDVRLLTRR